MARDSRSIQFFTRDEMQRVLAVAKERGTRDFAMVLLAYRHGLRPTEVCRVRLDDLDLDGGHILCRRQKRSITNWQRLADDERDAIHRWLAKRRSTGSSCLFPNRQGRPISRQQFFRIFRQLARLAGLPPNKRHPHILKHAIATHLAGCGVPVQVIQQRLGHRNIENTMVYLSIASEYVDRTVASAIEAGAVV